MKTKKNFETLDIYLTAFLIYHGLRPTLESRNGKIIFSFPQSDDLYRLMTEYNSDIPIPCASYVTTIKMVRSWMLAKKGEPHE